MPQSKLRTNAQNSMMFGLAAKAGLTHDDLKDWTAEITNGRTDHTSKLYHHEAIEIINRLEAVVNPGKSNQKWSPRTVQKRKQDANIKTIVTEEHLRKMHAEWNKVAGRTPSGLEALCVRTIKLEKPRTTKECNAIIEAIKSMNRRDNALHFKKNKEAA